MKCNVGGNDRTVRIVLGVVLLIVGLTSPIDMVWRAVALVIAAIALGTVLMHFCPINAILGINTCKGKDRA